MLGMIQASHLATPSNDNGRSFNGVIPPRLSPGAAEGAAEGVAEWAAVLASVVPTGVSLNIPGDVSLGPLLVLPYPVMFPFSWKRKGFTEGFTQEETGAGAGGGAGGGEGEGTQRGGGLMGANSLFEGQGFDWSTVYAMELYVYYNILIIRTYM